MSTLIISRRWYHVIIGGSSGSSCCCRQTTYIQPLVLLADTPVTENSPKQAKPYPLALSYFRAIDITIRPRMSQVAATWRSGERAGLITRRSLDRYQALLSSMSFFLFVRQSFSSQDARTHYLPTCKQKRTSRSRPGRRRGEVLDAIPIPLAHILRTTLCEKKLLAKPKILLECSLSCRKHRFNICKRRVVPFGPLQLSL